MTRLRLGIASRFWLVLVILVTAMATMGAAALVGLGDLHTATHGLHDRLVAASEGGDVRFHLGSLRSNLRPYATTGDEGRRRALRARIEEDLLHAGEFADGTLAAGQREKLEEVFGSWRAGAFDGPAAASAASRGEALLAPLLESTEAAADRELEAARTARHTADSQFARTRAQVVAVLLAALFLGVGMVVWLVRSIVPRTRDYSRFAARVSAGDAAGRLDPKGGDELAALGRTLDEMVQGHELERAYQATQHEFVNAMQVTESEDEAQQLLKHHVERSVAGSEVVVLNRNNSDDRLEPSTPVAAGSVIAARLDGAAPRSCLAVRFARRHHEGGDIAPLLSCGVCGRMGEMATCDPLLVGGAVIGAVLVSHDAPLGLQEDKRLQDSVSQAAPVLANLRNLAIAELRAATDQLTGLPNTRSVRDSLKRMVAQANRAERPLAAILLDLDHFKQINDTYGHGRGDEVLAAAAEAMRSALRTSDFVGRYGGEEFILLLPDTSRDDAVHVAETVRAAVATVSVPTVDRRITASLGIAILGEDGIDGHTLVRSADRALYAAKSLGRDRVTCAGAVPLSSPAAA